MANKDAAQERIERLEEQLARKKAQLIRERGKLSERARRERMRKMVRFGALGEIAELLDADEAFVLGLLTSGKLFPENSPEWRKLRTAGERLLKDRGIKTQGE